MAHFRKEKLQRHITEDFLRDVLRHQTIVSARSFSSNIGSWSAVDCLFGVRWMMNVTNWNMWEWRKERWGLQRQHRTLTSATFTMEILIQH